MLGGRLRCLGSKSVRAHRPLSAIPGPFPPAGLSCGDELQAIRARRSAPECDPEIGPNVKVQIARVERVRVAFLVSQLEDARDYAVDISFIPRLDSKLNIVGFRFCIGARWDIGQLVDVPNFGGRPY
jgi:hypothetical protein